MSLSTDITKRRSGATTRARRLRREETDAERTLWRRLSGRELGGFKFVRQIPIGPYVADFLCRSARLIIELDGEQHAKSARDEQRTLFLNEHGYAVLRFWNHEVLREREAVLEAILAALEGRVSGEASGLRLWLPEGSPSPARLSPSRPLPIGERGGAGG
jgi:very-short-patch-repair endonuclease